MVKNLDMCTLTRAMPIIWVFEMSKLDQNWLIYSCFSERNEDRLTWPNRSGIGHNQYPHSSTSQFRWSNLGTPASNGVIFQISWLVWVDWCQNDQKKPKTYLLIFIWVQNYQNNFQKWPFSLMSPSIFDIVLMILKPCESLKIKFRFFLVIETYNNPG